MAYNKTTWLDRAVQFPNRYDKSGETSSQVTLVANPGTVTQTGTPINAANLNKLEQGVADAVPKGVNSSEIVDVFSLFNEVDTRAGSVFYDTSGQIIGVMEYDAAVQGAQTANFVGKVVGSNVVNPHIFRRAAGDNNFTVLKDPSSSAWTEAAPSQINTLDGSVFANQLSVINGWIAQCLFSFDLISLVERLTGLSIGNTTAEKVAWLGANIKVATCNWYGYGSSPLGNKAYLGIWRASTSSWWTTFLNHTNATVTKLAYDRSSSMSPPLSDMIDSNGFLNYIAYADASNGTTASSINTDYVELVVTFNYNIMRSTAYNWSNGLISSIVQKANGKTATLTYSFDSLGNFTGYSKTVS